MSFARWIFLDSNCTNTTDTYCFSKNNSNKPENGYFAIITEESPQTTTPTRSKIGAKLLVDASQLAFAELQEKRLDFTLHFFNLLNEAWKTKVLLHAIQNPFPDTVPLSIEKLTENDTLRKEVVKNYDASVGIIYLDDNQLIFLQSGDVQLALLNKRNNCEIKKTGQQSLSTILNSTPPSYQLIDIEKYQLEMMALLPHKYTVPKTGARLKSNILKIYRSFESNNVQIEYNDNTQLLILKRDQNKTPQSVTTKKTTSPVTLKKEPAKKSMTAYALSIFLLVSGISASYFLWQVQAEEGTSTPLSNDSFTTTKLALSNAPETTHPKKTPLEAVDKKLDTKNQINEFEQKETERLRTELIEKEVRAKKERDLELRQKEKEQAAFDKALKIKTELAAKKADTEKEEKLQQQKKKQANIAEALRVKAIQDEKARKEKELKEKIEAESRERKLQEQQKKEASLRSIEKDLEVINRQNEKKRLQQQVEEQKRKENQARLATEKQAETKRIETLIQKRRKEFEDNKNKQKLPTPIEPNTPKSREELQIQSQELIKQKEAEKKRMVAEELKKQQAGKIKAKEAREKVIQKTITHQLMNYSKTFHSHAVQLKQKNKAIEKSINDPSTAHNQKRLESNKKNIEQRLNRLATLYSEKIKKICANKVVHPVSISGKLTRVERIALSAISQKLRGCSKPQTLSSKSIYKSLINEYLK